MHSNFITPSRTVAFSGYRPGKIIASQSGFHRNVFEQIQSSLSLTVSHLAEQGKSIFLTGMAQGFDLMGARAVLKAQNKHPNLELICVLAFPEQAERFSDYWQAEFYDVLKKSDSIITVSSIYYEGIYHRRNEFLVDNSSVMVCYYDGQPGGTKYTVELARKSNLHLINLCNTNLTF